MRYIVMLLLLITAAPAWAEWVRLSQTDGTVLYVDFTTLRANGDTRRVWTLQDLKQRESNGEMSMRGLHEYDCQQERWRTLQISAHSEPMARGKTLWTYSSPSKWEYIPPGTPAETILEIICGKSPLP